ncbi:hypothetical protein G7Y89_g10298 [Cudoniella acicularis]|uniref:CHAT domain-containing protein n=1 Tax=Cudoniella acicularis TaxID=354080 RepID=A0A8H4REM2_9HELO|nr:hypothetical protein G7Y89_g10298 [Cudoniella acicularis]
MAASSSMAAGAAIAESRRESSVENFPDALRILTVIHETSSSVRAEIFRIRIILGDHKPIAFTSTVTPPVAQGDEPYNELLFIQTELSRVSANGELAQSLQSATSLFQKYKNVLDPGQSDSVVILILYYCLEVRYFWKLYGDGIPDPQIEYNGTFLQQLIFCLTKEGFYFEALELLEHFVKDCNPQLEAMASSLLAEDNLAGTACLIRLAAIHGINGNTEGIEDLLSLIDQLLSDGHQIAKIKYELIRQRFLEAGPSPSDRIERLLQLSKTLLDLGDYNTALHALEYAAEVQCTLFASRQTIEHAMRIHSSLQVVCEQNNDHLSQILFQFRNCDVINLITSNLSDAIKKRNALLSAPLCAKLPYFQRFHRRQWAEYFMLHQRENALHHAKKYLEYCWTYRSAEEQSIAENMRMQTELQPARMSEEARESSLEGVRQQLEQGIETDKANGWYLPQVEKQLLLVEVLEELGRIQEEEHEEIARIVVGILDDAASSSNKVEWKSENVYLKFEIIFLKGAASDLSQGVFMDITQGSEAFETNDSTDSSLRPQEYFHKARSFQELMFAIRNESLPAFQRLFKQVCQYMDRLNIDEDFLKRAELLNFRGILYYFLMEFESTTIRQFWEVAGFKSLIDGAKMALECFKEAFDLSDKMAKCVTDRNESVDTMTKLAAGQAYFTNAFELLIFDIALELAFGLQDKKQTWRWIQRSKARALSEMLRSSLNPGDLQNGPDYLALSESLNMSRDEMGPIAVLEMVEIDTPMEDLKEAARRITDVRMDGPDASEYLRPFIPTIQPLVNSSEPEDILLLSLTAPLHGVPLHAVTLDSGLLIIERNPIVYVPSHSALLSCLQRRSSPEHGAEAPTKWHASVFGAYDDNKTDSETVAERSQIYSCLTNLAHELGTEAVVGASLTKTLFEQLSPPADLLHFHGHGIFDIYSPKRNSLVLGPPNEILTMPNIVALNLHATHVTLIACSGAMQDFSLSGDEPLGLLSSFLLGGASSVVGALWPIQSSTGRLFTRIFYNYFLHHVDRTELGPIVNLAMALQHTVLKIKKLPGTETPYHWAPFVEYGVWFCRRKPGSW